MKNSRVKAAGSSTRRFRLSISTLNSGYSAVLQVQDFLYLTAQYTANRTHHLPTRYRTKPRQGASGMGSGSIEHRNTLKGVIITLRQWSSATSLKAARCRARRSLEARAWSFHAVGNVLRGRFPAKSPGEGAIQTTQHTRTGEGEGCLFPLREDISLGQKHRQDATAQEPAPAHRRKQQRASAFHTPISACRPTGLVVMSAPVAVGGTAPGLLLGGLRGERGREARQEEGARRRRRRRWRGRR